MSVYLDDVVSGKLPQNNEILYNIQTALNLLPNTGVPAVTAAMHETANDQHLSVYIASLVRATLALHDLVSNKTQYKTLEEGEGKKEKEGAEEKKEGDKDKKEGKEAEKKEEKKDKK